MTIPNGQYILKITKCSYREGRIQPMLTFHSQVDEGPHAGSLLAFSYNFGPYGMVLIKALVHACDIPHIYHDSIPFESFIDRRFVAAVTYGGMGLPQRFPFIRPALLSEESLKAEFRAIRRAWRDPEARVVEVDTPLLTYNPADNVVPRYDIVTKDGEPWPQMEARCSRFRSDQPNIANGPKATPEPADAKPATCSAYCTCASPRAKHVKFDTFEYDKCDGCGKEIKP